MNKLCGCFGRPSSSVNQPSSVSQSTAPEDDFAPIPGIGKIAPWQYRKLCESIEVVEARMNRIGGDKYGQQPLHHAAKEGKLEEVQALCDSGADIDAATKMHMTPLFLAVLNNKVDIVKELLSRNANTWVPGGAELRGPEPKGVRLACAAARYGFEEVLKLLIQHDRESMTKVAESGYTPIHEAARYNQVGILKLFAEHGIDLNIRNAEMGTPLEAATRDRCFGAVCYLKTPPTNEKAVQVIRNECRLRLDDLREWSHSSNASGLDDLRVAIQAIYTAWLEGDIDGSAPEVQSCVKGLITGTITKVGSTFSPEEGSKQQLYYIALMSKLCASKGLLNDSLYSDLKALLTLHLKVDLLAEETRANFGLCFDSMKFSNYSGGRTHASGILPD